MARTRKTAEKPKKTAATAAVEETAVQDTPVEEDPAESNSAAPKSFSMEEVQAMIAEAVAKATANVQPMRVYANPKDELVSILYMDECASDNVLQLPGYGTITPGGFIEIPKGEFTSTFMSLLARKLIESRKLIVMNGLTDDERVRWKVNYKEGEVLDMAAFDKMLDYDTEDIVRIFKALCPEHKSFVASRFMSAYFPENGGPHDNRISFEKAKALNEASRETDPKGMFQPIVDAAVKELAGA